MRLNPFGHVRELRERIDELERRESTYTNALIAQITASAGGESTAKVTATAALEACAGLVSRAFATATVQSSDTIKAVLTPSCLALIGRELIKSGEIVFAIETDNGMLELAPASEVQVLGNHRPSTWEYKLTLAGPSEVQTYESLPYDGVVHIQYAREARRPWRGLSPVGIATLSGKLSAETVNLLADESSGPRATIVGIPTDGDDDTVNEMKKDIRQANGAVLLMESGDWAADGKADHAQYQPRRIGANPPAALVSLLETASREIHNACGIPSGLLSAGGQSSAIRESYRQFLHVTVAPLAKIVSDELSTKMEDDVMLGFDELRAGDVAGAARAFKGFVDAGMDLDRALTLSGLMAVE